MAGNVNLPPELLTRLEQEAERIGIDAAALLAGLVAEYLNRRAPERLAEQLAESPSEGLGNTATNAAAQAASDEQAANRRTHSRVEVSAAAMLHFSSENGKAAMYKAGDLKDVAPGGVRIECAANFPVDSLAAAGRKFELIVQPREEEPPLRLRCEVCRISRQGGKTVLGVSFEDEGQGLSPETIRILSEKPGRRKK